MLINDIRDVFNNNLNIVLTPNITINKIYREHDRKPNNNFVYFKEEYRTIEQGCTTSIGIEVTCVFENELLAMRCRDEIIKMINENSIFSFLLGNHDTIYTNGTSEYNKTLFISSLSVKINLL
jgi:hypothetical protein